jgi:hypothetical protein
LSLIGGHGWPLALVNALTLAMELDMSSNRFW